MKGRVRKEFLWIAFGVGCVAACCLPTIWITRILSIVVIILGIMSGGIPVKVVLIKSPKFLSPILRAVFKIEKVKEEK